MTLWLWTRGAYRHGADRGFRFSRVLLTGWWLLAPALLAVQFATCQRRSTRYYFSPQRDACLAITGHRGRWSIGEHLSAVPRTKQGAALRELLLPRLQAHADARALAITTTAATRRLAEVYMEALPGLRDIGAAFPRGRKLRRDPAGG